MLARFSATGDQATQNDIVLDAISNDKLAALDVQLEEFALKNYLTIWSSTNRSINEWVMDIQFVADNVNSVQAPFNGFSENLSTGGFGVFGMSFGGAAAAEFCKVDPRCRAGSNMDGTQWGKNWSTPVQAPFLMLSKESSGGSNDYALLPAKYDFFEYSIQGSKHADFMDVPLVVPLLGEMLYGLGDIKGNRIAEILNAVYLSYFDHYLKGIGKFDPGNNFSEIGQVTRTVANE